MKDARLKDFLYWNVSYTQLSKQHGQRLLKLPSLALLMKLNNPGNTLSRTYGYHISQCICQPWFSNEKR